ncbi:MAG: hypothetical protein V4760_16065 [Bdellovibrionota bacterium]
MKLKTAVGLLAPTLIAISMVACTVKDPIESPKVTDDDLVEQSTSLADLQSEDLIQLLFDEASRMDRAVRLATQTPSAVDTLDGCVLFHYLPASKQTLVVFDCSGQEERRDTENIGRTLRGREVLRLTDEGGVYAGDNDIRRFRPGNKAKTLRLAKVSRSIRFTREVTTSLEAAVPSLVADGKTHFAAQKTKLLPNAETWTTAIHGEWKRVPGQPLVMGAGSKLSLVFKGESGSNYELVLTPTEEIAFERALNNKCLRPMGTFAMKLTQRKVEKQGGDVKVSVIEQEIEATPEGFTFADSTSVVAWPMGCLENVP